MTRSRDIADQQKNLGGAVSPAMAGKNAIINGGLDIWQRGTSFTNVTVNAYNADRFLINRGGDVAGFNISQSTDVPNGFQYSMKWQRASGNTDTTTSTMYYGLESKDSYKFVGQTATLSFYAKKGANYSGGNLSIAIGSGTATDARPYQYTTTVANSNVALNTSWTRYSLTGTFGSNITQAFFATAWSPSGTAGADDSVYITGFQLELGSVATPFSRAGGTIQGELAACQRYFQRIGNNGGAYYMYTSATVEGTSTLWGTVPLPVTMRTTPSISATSSGNTFTILGYANVNSSVIYLDAAQSGPQSIVMGSNSISGLTLRQSCYIRNLNDTSGTYISMNAEL